MTTFAGWGDGRASASWRIEAGMAVVTLQGELDIHTAPSARAVIAEAARSNADVILDLSGLAFADSSVLNLVLWARNSLRPRLAGPLPRQLARLFRAADLDLALSVFPDLAAALGGTRHPPALHSGVRPVPRP
jgi:anti-anti-sigma factor